MEPRVYGGSPYRVALVHGGPGAAGEMAPVACELATGMGVLEPFQTALSVQEQVKELGNCLERQGDLPMVLVGFSWGAWLSLLVAAQYPALVKKLILISSGGFSESDAQVTENVRTARMTPAQKEAVQKAMDALGHPGAEPSNQALAGLGKLFRRIDAFDPMEEPAEEVQVDARLHCVVWADAAEWRRNGRLLEAVRSVTCPVVALHGAYDPHPAEGVRQPLAAALREFRFILLSSCGHVPWIERQAREVFYRALRAELDAF